MFSKRAIFSLGFLTIILFLQSSFATQRVRPPKEITISGTPQGPKITWDYTQPDTIFSYNNGQPGGIWGLVETAGLGVIFDLSAYPGATLEEIDFIHYGNETVAGPYYYNIHVYDMDSLKEVATLDSLVAGDALLSPRYETYVSLGSLPYVKNVGIFIQGLTSADSTDYSYPSLLTDGSPLVPGTSYMCINFDDPFDSSNANYTNIYELNAIDSRATNVNLDLWINVNKGGKKVKLSDNLPSLNIPSGNPENLPESSFQPFGFFTGQSFAVAADSGFRIYRGKSFDSLENIYSLPYDVWEYTDETAPKDSSYFYGIAVRHDTLFSEIKPIPYYNSIMTIASARQDTNIDFIPDRITDTVQVYGVVNSPNFGTATSFFIQDKEAGIYVHSEQFTSSLQIGDSVYIKGVIGQSDGLTTISPLNMESLVVMAANVSLDTLNFQDVIDPEMIEGMLLRLYDFELVDSSQWPAEGESKTVLITNGEDTVDVYIDAATDLDGWTPPNDLFDVVGIVDQYSQKNPADDGYRLRPRMQSDFITLSGLNDDTGNIPQSFHLYQNYPNPFNPVTVIKYNLPVAGKVNLEVYNLVGQKVATLVDSKQSAGSHLIEFNASALASGVYLYKITAGSFSAVRKMVLLK